MADWISDVPLVDNHSTIWHSQDFATRELASAFTESDGPRRLSSTRTRLYRRLITSAGFFDCEPEEETVSLPLAEGHDDSREMLQP